MILTISVNFKESSDFKDIEMKICALNDNAGKSKAELDQLDKSVNDSSRKDIETIVTFQDKIFKQLIRRVAELGSEITAKTTATQLTISNLKTQAQTADISPHKLKNDMEANQDNNILLFISAYRSKKKEKAISNKLQQVRDERKQIPTFELEMNKDTESALDNWSWIATYTEIKDRSGTESCNEIGPTKPHMNEAIKKGVSWKLRKSQKSYKIAIWPQWQSTFG